ncbi:periplasmic chaperone for outer membrane proteins Skp [Nitrosomonas cryotolerans]|uniref:Periplasmic chaperone for outer membrane proteins Skp n=1 Tax=Nitrosomonas cryotolerans ATCC 49181 TaxID=1131553 RepID=A0A1N6FBT5_9PROT|nr:periplasmic chaperone for outer membrane proteins Skp [Nitrosomonas cryotolerans]SIN92755.1 periplasmic chaperone for outer membrane proteins Skp [Nitrosomonas cryotolerans ATCC 49181]
MKRKLLIACMVIVSISGSLDSDANEIKIGVVNTEKILRESAAAVRAQKSIEQEFLLRDEQIKKMANQAKILQDRLEEDSTAMAEAERRNLERDLANLSREYQRAQRQMREDLSVRQNDEYGLILERTNHAINSIAETERYDLILQLQDSVYRSQRIDITDKVIQALDKK